MNTKGQANATTPLRHEEVELEVVEIFFELWPQYTQILPICDSSLSTLTRMLSSLWPINRRKPTLTYQTYPAVNLLIDTDLSALLCISILSWARFENATTRLVLATDLLMDSHPIVHSWRITRTHNAQMKGTGIARESQPQLWGGLASLESMGSCHVIHPKDAASDDPRWYGSVYPHGQVLDIPPVCAGRFFCSEEAAEILSCSAGECESYFFAVGRVRRPISKR